MTATHDPLLDALKRTFGHDGFRPMQRQAIEDAQNGRDVLLVMPTGGGKSLCYQLPAVLADRPTVVISPLIALMEDQVKALQANGVEATFLNSSLDPGERQQRARDAENGRYQLIYLAPERMATNAGLRLIERIKPGLFAVDEAHCISEWGHDFRPEYRQLHLLRERCPGTPMMALTATATPQVTDDIALQLKLQDPATYRGDFERRNLFYEVRPKQRVADQILRYLQEHPHHEGIIYTLSRNGADTLAEKLRAAGIAALPYHAGLESEMRRQHQHDFVYGDCRVVVATIAFGMGIDKPDVRFVMHADLPRHIEGYYQETGRAGRDGAPADCILFFSHSDRQKIEYFIRQKETEQEREHAYWQLQQMTSFAYTTGCRMTPLLEYFGETPPGRCDHCDNCRFPPKLLDATEDARKLLSAVARTGQRFGVGHVIDVLRGSDNEKLARNRHHDLSVFGIGADKPAAHWRRVAEQLLEAGHLGQTTDQYPTLHLTPESKPVLRGEAAVEIVQPRAVGAKTKRKKAAAMAYDGPVDEALFERLRKLRKRLADEQAVPPYVVFTDASLREMAGRKPTTLDAFGSISGVGAHKLERYGRTFIDAITDYADVPGG